MNCDDWRGLLPTAGRCRLQSGIQVCVTGPFVPTRDQGTWLPRRTWNPLARHVRPTVDPPLFGQSRSPVTNLSGQYI